MRKVLIAIPAMDGTIHMGTMRALMAEMLGMLELKWTYDLFEVVGCSLMEDARNLCVSRFLGSDFENLVFLDHDVTWAPGAMIRLLNKPVDVVAGAYRHRTDPETYPVKWLTERDELWADPETGLLEVEAVPTGFLRISRAAAERMRDACDWYHDAKAPDGKSWTMFDRIRDENHQKWGEDFAFCKRWRDLGGKVWLDPEIEMGHIGNKTFTGTIGSWLKGRDDGAG